MALIAKGNKSKTAKVFTKKKQRKKTEKKKNSDNNKSGL